MKKTLLILAVALLAVLLTVSPVAAQFTASASNIRTDANCDDLACAAAGAVCVTGAILYVCNVGGGNYDDPSSVASFDSTTVDDTTWSDNVNATNTWTFDVSGTDHTMIAGSALMTFSAGVTIDGVSTLTGETDLGSAPTIFSNTSISMQLDEDNNTGNSFFVFGGDDVAILTMSELGKFTLGGTSPVVFETGSALAFGDNTDATITHTVDLSGTDVVMAYSTGALAVTGAVSVSGVSTLTGETDLGTSPTIFSNTGIILQLDEDADGTESVVIQDGADGAIFTFQEDGVMQHGATINDNVCDTAGEWWWDTTATAFHFCEAASGAPATLGTGSFDSTAIDATTWSDNLNASNIWTFDVSTGDHTMTAGNALMTFSAAVTVGGILTVDGASILTGETDLGTSPTLFSNTGITIQLDEDNNGTEAFIIQDGADVAVFTFMEAGIIEAGSAMGFGDSSDATITHTYGLSGTNVVIAYSAGTMVITGVVTADGLTLGANENIQLGAIETLDHDGTDFVFSDTVRAPEFTTGPSATPNLFMIDDHANAGEAKIILDGDAVGPDALLDFQGDIGGTLTTFFRLDGVDETIELLKPVDIGTAVTFTSADTTPNVRTGSYFKTNATTVLIADFDTDGPALSDGHLLFVESGGATTYDCTGAQLDCGTVDIVTATGDITTWIYTGVDWELIAFKDDSTDMGTDAGASDLNDLETTMTDVLDFEVAVGASADTGAYIALAECNADQMTKFTDAAPNTVTCVDITGLTDADLADDITITTTKTLTTEALVDIGAVEVLASNTTPDVSTGIYFATDGTALTLTDFTGTPLDGQILYVESTDATVFDCTSSGLDCGSTNIITAVGDLTVWLHTGVDWQLLSYLDVSTDMGTDDTGSGSLGSNLASTTNDIISNVAVTSAIVLGGEAGTELLTFDFETNANEVGISSTTGVTIVDFGIIELGTPVVGSDTSVTIQLDEDNNGSESFIINDGADTAIYTFTEAGTLTIAGASILDHGAALAFGISDEAGITHTIDLSGTDVVMAYTSGALALTGSFSVSGLSILTGETSLGTSPTIFSNTGITMQLDEDADGSESFVINDGADVAIYVFSEAGTVTIAGTPVIDHGAALSWGIADQASVTHTFTNTGTDVAVAYSTAAMVVTGALTSTIAGAGEAAIGTIEIATQGEANDGTGTLLAVTADKLQAHDGGPNIVTVGALVAGSLDASSAFTLTTESKIWIPAATCVGATGTNNWDDDPILGEPAAACLAGTNVTKGVTAFDGVTDEAFQTTIRLPGDFTGAIDVDYKWYAAVTTGSATFCSQIMCTADDETDDAAFAVQAATNCVTDAAKGITLQTNDASDTGIDATCSAGELMHIRLSRDPDATSTLLDDITADVTLIGATYTIRRAQ